MKLQVSILCCLTFLVLCPGAVYQNSIVGLSFWKNFHPYFNGDCTNLHSYQQYVRFPCLTKTSLTFVVFLYVYLFVCFCNNGGLNSATPVCQAFALLFAPCCQPYFFFLLYFSNKVVRKQFFYSLSFLSKHVTILNYPNSSFQFHFHTEIITYLPPDSKCNSQLQQEYEPLPGPIKERAQFLPRQG